MWFSGYKLEGIFVGIWVPSILSFSIAIRQRRRDSKKNNMDKLIFIVGFIIFSIYLGCLVYVISTQNKIQETLEDEDPELNN